MSLEQYIVGKQRTEWVHKRTEDGRRIMGHLNNSEETKLQQSLRTALNLLTPPQVDTKTRQLLRGDLNMGVIEAFGNVTWDAIEGSYTVLPSSTEVDDKYTLFEASLGVVMLLDHADQMFKGSAPTHTIAWLRNAYIFEEIFEDDNQPDLPYDRMVIQQCSAIAFSRRLLMDSKQMLEEMRKEYGNRPHWARPKRVES